MTRPAPLWDALVIFSLAVGIRVLYLVGLQQDPFAHDLVCNALLYDELGREIAAGGGLSPASGAQALYPHVVALVYTVFGPSPVAVRLLQIAAGGATAALLTVATGAQAGRRQGLVAGLLWSVFWPSVLYGGELLPDTLVTTLVVLALVVCWIAVFRGGWWLWLLGGLALGLAALGKPNAVLLAVFAPLASLVAPRQNPSERRRRALMACAVPALALGTLLAGGALYQDGGKGGGAPQGKVLWDGNHRYSDGINPFLREYPEVAHWPEWQDLEDTAAVSRACMRDLGEFARQEPGRLIGLQGRKALAYLSTHEVANNLSPTWRRERSAMLRLPWPGFGLLLSLACAGVVVALRRWRDFALPLAWIAAWSISVVLIIVAGRLRLPGAALLCVPAALGAVGMADAALQRQRKALAVLLAAASLGALVASVDWLGLHEYRIASVLQMEAQVLERAGDLPGAEERYLAGVELQRGGPRLQGSYGLFLSRHGRQQEALTALAEAVRREPGRAALHKNLGATLRDAGRPGEALPHLRRAAELDTEDAGVRYDLGLALLDLGQIDEAERAFSEALQGGASGGDLYLMRGLARARQGRWAEAEADLQLAAGELPGDCRVHSNLGLLYENIERWDDAVAAYAACPQDPRSVAGRCRASASGATGDGAWFEEHCTAAIPTRSP